MTVFQTILNRLQTPRFWVGLILGQFLSICISTTNVTTRLMSEKYQLNIPTTQSFGNYVLLAIVFSCYTLFRVGFAGVWKAFKARGLIYLFLSLVDVEANYFVVKGFANTSFLSAMLIGACSTPSVVLLSFFFLKTRYQWTHLTGVALTVIGLVLLVVSDVITDKNYEGSSPLNGNLYCIIAAFLYAISNTLEEFFVRKHPTYEILAFLGTFGMVINLTQLLIFESGEFKHITFNGQVIGLYAGFTIAMFSLYSLVPVLIGLTNATFYNISLLTSDFYGLIIGLYIFKYVNHPLYPVAFTLVVIGLIFFNIRPVVSRFDSVSNTELPDIHQDPVAIPSRVSSSSLSVADSPKDTISA